VPALKENPAYLHLLGISSRLSIVLKQNSCIFAGILCDSAIVLLKRCKFAGFLLREHPTLPDNN
jgi:hypothetical protein